MKSIAQIGSGDNLNRNGCDEWVWNGEKKAMNGQSIGQIKLGQREQSASHGDDGLRVHDCYTGWMWGIVERVRDFTHSDPS